MAKATGRPGLTNTPLTIVPLGGLGEIGMNCMVIETADELVVVDCGILFSDLEHFGVEFAIPDFTYLKERRDKLKAILITHGHEDHIGALPFLLKAGLNAPIYCSNFTSLLIKKRLIEQGLESSADIRVFKSGQTVEISQFKVKPVSVSHSIIDSMALLIDTPHGKVIHTGDFKMESEPFIGRPFDITEFKKAGEEGVLLLMSDSTNVERHEHSLSESVIYQKFEQLFAAAEGLIVVSMFASNVSRMGQVFDLAKRMGKKIALAGRSMDQNVRLAADAGYLKNVDGVLIDISQIDQYRRNDIIVLSTGSQGEHRASLIRMAHDEHPHVSLQEGDVVMMSSKFIPGNEKAIGRMINDLFKQGAEVLYEAVHDIHTSGHATRPELKLMIEAVKPKYFLPIHGEYRHLVHHADLASETGLDDENILIAVDGEKIELSPNGFAIVGKLDNSRILVEGREGAEMSRLVLKDRRQLGEKGVVFALLVRNVETRQIISGPEIICRGLAHEGMESFLIEEAKALVKKIVTDYEAGISAGRYNADLQETIRIELRRFFNTNIGRKPVVLPMVLDL